jgi:hypothetical protein
MMQVVADLRARPVAESVEELLDGAVRLGEHQTNESRSSAAFEAVELDGERCIVKYVEPATDFMMRVSGDVDCRIRRVWASGLMDVAPDVIDHATLGAARWGHNGYGVALLMRDVGERLIPSSDEPITEAEHLALLDGVAGLAAATWGWSDPFELLPHRLRWAWWGEAQVEGERDLGFPEAVPRIAADGWQRFGDRAPADVLAAVTDLRRDTTPLSDAIRTTPQCFLHGDWKLGNVGIGGDGRVVLLDWAYPGEGPVAHELGWYLALNRARLPVGHTKESTIEALRAALEGRGVTTDGWWETQLDLCLLGALVQFGWEKALGDDDELHWWVDRAREGLRRL